MRQEKQMLARQNDQLKSRVQKLKDEFIAEREKLNGVRYVLLDWHSLLLMHSC